MRDCEMGRDGEKQELNCGKRKTRANLRGCI
jgi:hypothetical protein